MHSVAWRCRRIISALDSAQPKLFRPAKDPSLGMTNLSRRNRKEQS
jgi:hypothetical protein